jgi:hypothetical protein
MGFFCGLAPRIVCEYCGCTWHGTESCVHCGAPAPIKNIEAHDVGSLSVAACESLISKSKPVPPKPRLIRE